MPLTFQAGNGFSFLRGCYAALTGGGERYGGGVPFFLNCFLALRDGKVLEKFLNSSIQKFRVY